MYTQTNTVWFYSYEVPRAVKFRDKGLREKLGSCSLMGPRFQFCKMESSGDWLHTDMNVLSTVEL
jgi:hypothetical protein